MQRSPLLFDMPATRRLLLVLGIAGVVLVCAMESEPTTTIKIDSKTTDNILPVVLSESRRINNDDNTDRAEYDEREARMSLQTESPMAKARREQALRNILAARRRTALRRRTSSEAAVRGTLSRRRPSPSKEMALGDVFEMQESQNGLYVTVPEQHSFNDTQEIIIETLGAATTANSSSDSGRRSGTMSISSKLYRNNGSMEHRGKKIVSMPASLYNHFRPVESNIPIEDMSQFLYFGQKLRGTGIIKDSSSMSSGPKKLLAGLEDMLDDDMNSVDKSSGILTSKSTKMRTTSLREQTTRPACPDKIAEARGNSINATEALKNSGSINEASLGLRVVVTEATINTTNDASVDAMTNTTSPTLMSFTTPTSLMTTTTIAATNTTTSTTTTTTTTTTITSAASATATATVTTKEETVAASKPEQEQQQQHVSEQSAPQWQQRQRSALRNSHIVETGGLRSSSSSPGAARFSAGATVERVAAPLSVRVKPAAAAPQQQSGFTIRWTDARPASAASKRRRPPSSRRREKAARAMDEPATATPAPRMLDPSEVQKMYRSGSTAKPESAATEAPARSPEVHARNLEDRTKDDVLPIMQLYNTSSMFNGSEVSAEPEPPDTTSLATTATMATTAGDGSTTSTTASAPTTSPAKSKSERHDGNGYTRTSHGSAGARNTVGRTGGNRTTTTKPHRREYLGEFSGSGYYPLELNHTGSGSSSSSNNSHNNNHKYNGSSGNSSGTGNNTSDNISGKSSRNNRTFLEPPVFITVAPREPVVNISEVISRRHDGDALASQETVAVVSYILATLVVFPIAVGVGLILRRLILRNRKVLEESDTSSEISCRKDALNLETGDFKMSIEKTITKLPRIQHLCHEAEKPLPPSSQESRWEFSRDKLRLQTVLGEGNFGQVWKAEADDLTGHQGTTRLVAVKTVKEGASDREKEDLVRELEIMQRVGSHPNVVTLLGCCTEQEPHYLILEYVMYGKLLAYLRDHRTRQDFYNFSEDSAALTSRDLTVFGYCVARGMEYLASKKIIHRDLAARNVLVDHNKLCKIADFGMSRFANEDGEVIETRHGRNALPIRWMAPESLIYSLFTTKTDVWSFGILMWEIVTLGSTPYPDMTAREVMRSVQSGYRLERPSHCRSELFRVIARCWHADPDRRPEFQVLRRDLAQLLEDNMNGHYVDLESFASECTD